MITTKEVTYTKTETIKTWHCDFCSYTTQDNRGYYCSQPVMECSLCKKHMCTKHRNWYEEDSNSDYADALICPSCDKKFRSAWEWALDNAGRNDDIVEATIKRMKEEEEHD